MNDENCVLCEFHNEGDSVAVGYREWFFDEVNDKALDDIIKRETEIKMRWPITDIGSSNVMKKRLKTCEWQEVVAKICAYGSKLLFTIAFYLLYIFDNYFGWLYYLITISAGCTDAH